MSRQALELPLRSTRAEECSLRKELLLQQEGRKIRKGATLIIACLHERLVEPIGDRDADALGLTGEMAEPI
jgi:hypothetical protein